jgi:hypothetical protein
VRRWLFLTLLLISAITKAEETFVETVTHHLLMTEGPGPTGDIVVIAKVTAASQASEDIALAEHIAVNKLRRFRLDATNYPGNFQNDFSSRNVPEKFLLSRKLIIQIEMKSEQRGSYHLNCALALLEYHASSTHTYVAKVIWERKQDIGGIPDKDIAENLHRYVQKAVGTLIEEKGDYLRRNSPTRASETCGPGKAQYSLYWKDTDNLRNHFLIGATLGTPAIGNLYVGFWGSRDFPLVTGISGMYYGDSQRGIQVDLGWAFDNTGEFRQVVGMGFAFLNETSSNSSNETNELGVPTSTTTVTTNDLKPFLGPTYTAEWNNIRLQAGVTYRLDPSSQSTFRFLVQLGYVLPVGF